MKAEDLGKDIASVQALLSKHVRSSFHGMLITNVMCTYVSRKPSRLV